MGGIGEARGPQEGREGHRRGGRAIEGWEGLGGTGGGSTVEKLLKARLGNGVEGI